MTGRVAGSVVSLFSGIGGIEAGLGRAGFQAEMLCELDPAARAVLAHHFPGVDLPDDVAALKSIPPAEILTAGFPCQDLSQAGRKAGIDGSNSGLVRHVFRLVRKARPKPEWLVMENVSYMLRLDQGRGMAYLISEIEDLGYRWAYRVVDARAFDVPQRRKRVILVASRSADPSEVLFADRADFDADEDLIGPVDEDAFYGFYWTEGLRGLGWARNAVPTVKGGSGLGIPSPPAIWDPASGLIGTPSLTDAERLQGFDPGWTEPAMAAGRRGSRWRLVGNAVCVPVAAWLGERLRNPGELHADTTPWSGRAWPTAACGCKGDVLKVHINDRPKSSGASLAPFLQDPLNPLSLRATQGFYRRARAGKLRFADGFLDDVRRHIEVMADGRKRATADCA